jgi:hypothetical protein
VGVWHTLSQGRHPAPAGVRRNPPARHAGPYWRPLRSAGSASRSAPPAVPLRGAGFSSSAGNRLEFRGAIDPRQESRSIGEPCLATYRPPKTAIWCFMTFLDFLLFLGLLLPLCLGLGQVSTYAYQIAVFNELRVTPNVLFGAKVGLFTNPIVPSISTSLASLTVATFTGYAEAVVTWLSSPYIDDTGAVVLTGQDHLFQPTDSVTPNTIYGWFLVDTTGAILYYVALLPEPVPLVDALHGLVITPTVPYLM